MGNIAVSEKARLLKKSPGGAEVTGIPLLIHMKSLEHLKICGVM